MWFSMYIYGSNSFLGMKRVSRWKRIDVELHRFQHFYSESSNKTQNRRSSGFPACRTEITRKYLFETYPRYIYTMPILFLYTSEVSRKSPGQPILYYSYHEADHVVVEARAPHQVCGWPTRIRYVYEPLSKNGGLATNIDEVKY